MNFQLSIDFVLVSVHHDCLANIYTTTDDPLSLRQTFRFKLNIVENEYQLHQILFPMFTRLRINTASVGYHSFIHEILQRGGRMSHWVLSRGINCKALHLRSVIQASIMDHYNDGILMGRAIAESESEFENINGGMVLAKESLVKKMLKTVRIEVGDEEDCMICLEELEVGFDALRMPCSHTFHGDCIEKWLRHGHCCPICRFKIPAN
ncbi:hypothetical protein Godav_000712 [Gossypium davidsonii]|uniref:RING-type E3 ubiquitin transferase n=2 Tax=Gossypium TaxID=3633 RepID=A0A7J8T0J3_GOSDV|nr:hypothetical protein [Gossypium davidsonii]MBA0667622.1 hypothetical protein [Gossypium klotzschianum]